jgi:putative transposase
MPAKNTIRLFTENGIYHIYNRGINKTEIFLDDEDYKIFLYYLFIYAAPLEDVIKRYPQLSIRIRKKNLSEEIDILTYCLMPNHFHLMMKQSTKNGISKFMKQISNAYTRYFNQKYNRVGPLFQGRYKAAKIETDEQLIHVSRYIHLNPVIAGITSSIRNDRWTSFRNYLIHQEKGFVNTELVLSFFKSPKDYEVFVLDRISYGRQLNKIKHLSLE